MKYLTSLLSIDKEPDPQRIEFINKNRIEGKVSIACIFFLIEKNNIKLLELVCCAGSNFPIIDKMDD